MRGALVHTLAICAACGGGADGGSGSERDGGPPGSGSGIAADYPGDVGIGEDPRVLFADDFESYGSADELDQRWQAVFNRVAITSDPANVFGGDQALEFFAPQQTQELSDGIAHMLGEERDVLFLRYASRFEATFDITGSSHNGGGISGH